MVKENAIFGMGCFWHSEAAFSKVEGVLKTEVGYMGGDEIYDNVSYEMVCSGKTGHAEVIKVEFDPSRISYSGLLDIFWENHDPTTLDRQGVDVGKQYRSVIFYFSKRQRKIAKESLNRWQKKFKKKKIVTEVVEAGKFYRAEEYHQKYHEKHGGIC